MLTPATSSPLPCSTCSGLGSLADDRGPASPRGQECPDCRGRGHLRCEDCGEPATRAACDDTNLKFCADCGAGNDEQIRELRALVQSDGSPWDAQGIAEIINAIASKEDE